MNCDLAEAEYLLTGIKQGLEGKITEAEVIVAPSFTNLFPAVESLKGTSVKVAAQNMHKDEGGAHTGEVSAKMIKSLGVDIVILGHSERRKNFKEDNYLLREKVEAALKNDFTIIFCIGEKL